ncbi:hypothetical protein H0H92_014551, partial [Tricholoma furcatifolium]
EGELIRNYNCCSIHASVADLHALLQIKDAHVIVVYPAGSAEISSPFDSQPLENQPPQPTFESNKMDLQLNRDNSIHHSSRTTTSTHDSPFSSTSPHTLNNLTFAQFAHNYPRRQDRNRLAAQNIVTFSRQRSLSLPIVSRKQRLVGVAKAALGDYSLQNHKRNEHK